MKEVIKTYMPFEKDIPKSLYFIKIVQSNTSIMRFSNVAIILLEADEERADCFACACHCFSVPSFACHWLVCGPTL